MDIFSEESVIRIAGVDQGNNLTIAATFDLFQDAALNHAEILGVGREAMTQNGQAWILSRISVFMERRPQYGERVTVRTWPRSSNKLFAVRDFDIRGSGGGDVLVRGRSGWLIIDLEKHRPLRPEALVGTLPPNEGLNALPGINADSNDPPPPLTAREFGTEQPVPRRACYSDIDYNGHVNNARYIQWIQDLFDPEILITAKQIRLDVNYLSEVRYGETISLVTTAVGGPYPGIKDLPKDAPEDNPLKGQIPQTCTAAFAVEGRRGNDSETVPVFRAELRTG